MRHRRYRGGRTHHDGRGRLDGDPAWTELLGRYAGQEDVLVGWPIAGRNRSELEGMIGFLANILGQVEKMADGYVASVKSLSGGELEMRKDEITSVLRAFRYLAKWNIVPAGFAPLAALDRIEKAQGWDVPKK